MLRELLSGTDPFRTGLSGPNPLLGSLPLDLPSMGVMAPLNRLAAKVLSTIVWAISVG